MCVCGQKIWTPVIRLVIGCHLQIYISLISARVRNTSKVMFLLCVSVHRGAPCREWGPPVKVGAPQVKVHGAPQVKVNVWGGPPGQGLGAPQVKVQGPPKVKVRGLPRSRSGAPQVKVQKGGGAGGMPLAVRQEDCLVNLYLSPHLVGSTQCW